MPTWIVTADRQSGKTTFLRHFTARASDASKSVGGVASPAVYQAERHIGYDLLNLHTGSCRPLARRRQPGDTGTMTGAYWFDDTALHEGWAAIDSAVANGLDVIGIDEIGPLELAGKGWFVALTNALPRLTETQHLIVVVRSSLVEGMMLCLPSTRWAGAVRVSPPWPQDL